MAWTWLVIAGVLEIVWAIGLKGMVLFSESIAPARIISIALIVGGIIGLKLSS